MSDTRTVTSIISSRFSHFLGERPRVGRCCAFLLNLLRRSHTVVLVHRGLRRPHPTDEARAWLTAVAIENAERDDQERTGERAV